MFELIRRLASRHEVDVLSFAGADGDPDAASALERAGPAHVWLVPRHPDRRPDWLGLRPAEVADYRDPAMTRTLGATLANGAYDLLQVEYSPMAEAEGAELRARGAAAPVAVSPMGVDTRGVLPPSPSEAAERGLIVLVGFFGHAPNVDAARWFVGDILPRVRAARPDARVALVG